MAYTTQDRDRLKAAIASGVLTVETEGRGRVTYRSMAELRSALGDVERELAATSGSGVRRTRQVVLTSRSGF
ncbi:phage head-tail joining protein [Enterovirga sp. CN4-39]|uniref:phage head-tail joining protein n=1 Tax=Enterovirga sp. CN4-39 TaxID=3400910 RepID=UPI003C0C4ACF